MMPLARHRGHQVQAPAGPGLLPASLDAERAVLGAILLDDRAMSAAAEVVRPTDFSHDSHRRIFACMVALANTGRPIDPVTLTEELRRTGVLEVLGGVGFLPSLTEGLPRSTNVAHYAQIVKDKAQLRRLAALCQSAEQQAMEPGADPAEVAEFLSAHMRNGVLAEREFRFRTAAEMAAETSAETQWIARPWLAAGSITEMHGKVKAAGKTTFLLALCRAVLCGTPFMGETTEKAP